MHTFYLQTCDGDLIAEVSIAENSLTMAVQQAIDNNIDLSDADFQGINLDSLLAAGAQLNRANFSQSSLVGADFRGAQLKDASFAYADLTGATFSNSSLNLLTDFTGSIMMNNCLRSRLALNESTLIRMSKILDMRIRVLPGLLIDK